jgi:putative aminopeptidase FrvX
VPSGIISVPCRYIHSPAAIMDLDDVNKTVELTVEAIRKVPEYF